MCNVKGGWEVGVLNRLFFSSVLPLVVVVVVLLAVVVTMVVMVVLAVDV